MVYNNRIWYTYTVGPWTTWVWTAQVHLYTFFLKYIGKWFGDLWQFEKKLCELYLGNTEKTKKKLSMSWKHKM